MKTKITITIIIFLISIISCLLFKNNQLLKKQLKEKDTIISNMKKQHLNNSIDITKINEENKKYQEENKKLSKEIRNIQSDCLHTCKIPNDLKNILNL